MHQLARIVRSATIVLIGGMSTSCAADRLASPVQPAVSAPLNDSRLRQLERDIGNLKATLAGNDFHRDLDPEDNTVIQERRERLQGLLGNLEGQLQALSQARAVLVDDSSAVAPACFVNGNLNACFLSATHTIAINGTGSVNQVTSVFASQSATVAYTLDQSPTPHQISVGGVGFSLSGWTLSQSFTYPAPDCNAGAHTVTSNATHQISMSIVGHASVGGVKPSSGGASCSNQGLTVTLSPSTIGRNSTANIVVSGTTQCVAASVSSSNTNVATVQDFGNNNFAAYDAGPGTATINATCGTQKGSATLTVTYPPPPPPTDGGTPPADPPPYEPPPDDPPGTSCISIIIIDYHYENGVYIEDGRTSACI